MLIHMPSSGDNNNNSSGSNHSYCDLVSSDYSFSTSYTNIVLYILTQGHKSFPLTTWIFKSTIDWRKKKNKQTPNQILNFILWFRHYVMSHIAQAHNTYHRTHHYPKLLRLCADSSSYTSNNFRNHVKQIPAQILQHIIDRIELIRIWRITYLFS